MITKQRAEYLLDCNFQTGELVWKFNHQRPDLIGQRAGRINEGYWRIAIDGRTYYAAQIIWLMAYGLIPEDTIDHRDMDKQNDALSNLRLATKGQNAANSKMNSRNTSGFRGVSFCSATGRWRASISLSGTTKNLGRYVTPELAYEAWKTAAIIAYGEEFVRVA